MLAGFAEIILCFPALLVGVEKIANGHEDGCSSSHPTEIFGIFDRFPRCKLVVEEVSDVFDKGGGVLSQKCFSNPFGGCRHVLCQSAIIEKRRAVFVARVLIVAQIDLNVFGESGFVNQRKFFVNTFTDSIYAIADLFLIIGDVSVCLSLSVFDIPFRLVLSDAFDDGACRVGAFRFNLRAKSSDNFIYRGVDLSFAVSQGFLAAFQKFFGSLNVTVNA